MPFRIYKAETKVNFTGYYSLYRDIKQGIIEPLDEPGNTYAVAFRRIPEHYRRFLKNRYKQAKRVSGSGIWPPIKDSTLRWRRKKYGIKHRQILYVTKTLYHTTDIRYDPGKGHYQKRIKYGIIVGVSSTIRHPDINKSLHGAVKMHAKGGPRLPRRAIYTEPNATTVEKVREEFRLAHVKALRKANNKAKRRRNS